MNSEVIENHTNEFAFREIRLVESLATSTTANVIENKLLRSQTSVEINYCEACPAKSTDDFIKKLPFVRREADETMYWAELLVESDKINHNLVENLQNENNEIFSTVFIANRKPNSPIPNKI